MSNKFPIYTLLRKSPQNKMTIRFEHGQDERKTPQKINQMSAENVLSVEKNKTPTNRKRIAEKM